jgi:hypothetical protein
MSGRTAPDGGRSSGARNPSRLVWSLIGAVAATIVFTQCPPPSDPRGRGDTLAAVPEDVLGVWVSDDERFVGRSITVTPDEVSLGVGLDSSPRQGRLIEARTWLEGGSTVIQFEYLGPDGQEFVELIFPANGGMHLRNPAEVQWSRRLP